MEIKAEDLMIGNYLRFVTKLGNLDIRVHHFNNEIAYAESINNDDDYLGININLLSGIPLSSKILTNIGFYKYIFHINGNEFIKWECPNTLFSIEIQEGELELGYCYLTKVGATSIDYLHELQNLYFAIIGQKISLNN